MLIPEDSKIIFKRKFSDIIENIWLYRPEFSWPVDILSYSQEIHSLLWKKPISFFVHNSPSPDPFVIQINQVHELNLSSSRSTLILFTHPLLGLPSGLFDSCFPSNSCIHLSSPVYMPHKKRRSFLLIWPPK